ncbi:family 10 glycosylhydrolase [Hymenobacter sp. BT175]|uniref:glycoside hydrolase family 10 protein n=1 Tax=Hymenobacter translucens TaxID=2886507 RepID=UPI001D0E1BF6|nr:family 10 glycosylhydrolase [Hymenobacter translucens]MCC2547163.1 family 10 glycosylhydrolase [Hymenobacter translucens]
MPRFLPASLPALFLLLVLLTGSAARAQDVPPKRELRGVWIATVENIDWPSSRTLTPEQQRREYRRMLDVQQRNGINAVFVQVRPAADAFYQSDLEPWSKWLTGTQGKAPSPYYDPLVFMIDEAHARGMEFHAWFNPYRASMDSVTRRLAPTHPFRKHPEWFLRYSGKLLFNPGIPEVRSYITQVVMDVVRRYDIDGVHFDDYFYPYPEPNQKLHDEQAFQEFNDGYTNLADWRRHNVNVFIENLHDSIQNTKRWVKFGISPFGVWMNKSAHPDGSDTRAGQPTYSNLYADTRLWLQKGWIDYILPQLYWSTNFKLVPYAVLLEWWTRNRFGRHLYAGQGAYRMLENTRSDTTWRNPRELMRQIRLNRSYPNEVSGAVFFSSKSLMRNPLHTSDSLRLNMFRYPALIPTMPWLDQQPPRPAQNLTLNRTEQAVALQWQPGPAAPDGDEARYYVVYRFGPDDQPSPADPRFIVGLVQQRGTAIPGFQDTTARAGTEYAYYVTAVDRLHNESSPIRLSTDARVNAAALAAKAAAPVAVPSPPVAAAPKQVVKAKTTAVRTEGDTVTKTKVKVKKKRGFFARLFGRK